jgi:hypothetical protein
MRDDDDTEPVTLESEGTESISLGSSYVLDGEARLGPLKIECDGAIAGQIWGAGATFSSYILSEEGRLLISSFDDRPDVIEVGSGTGVVGLAAGELCQHVSS